MKKKTKTVKRTRPATRTRKAKTRARRSVRTRSAPGENVLSKPQIIKAAVAFYEKDKRQAEIAKGLKISSSYLARILIKARVAGVYSVKVHASTGAVKVSKTGAKAGVRRRARR